MDDLKIGNQEPCDYYKDMICGERSLTTYERRAIPIMAQEHGLDMFMKAVLVVATNPHVSSPIKYLAKVMANWSEEDQRKAIQNLDTLREEIPPASIERDLAVLKRKAKEGNECMQAVLRQKGEEW